MRRAWLLLAACMSIALPALGRDGDPPNSIYHLEASLTNQAGQTHGLDVYRGHPVLITMFYASCPAVCPLILDTLRATEKELPLEQRADLRVLMISIDPERDSVDALRKLAEQRRVDTSRWTLARVDSSEVRTIAALLNVQYRKLPGGEYNHSTVITLLTPSGEIEASSSKLGTPDTELLAKLKN
jgi:protein SCO1/2